MKNMKMSTKISMIVIVVLAILLTILTGIVAMKASAAMKESAEMRFSEAAQSRVAMLDEYFDKLDLYMANLAGSQPVKLGLSNPTSESEVAVTQDYIDNYALNLDGIEGLFANTPETLQVAHSIHDAVGSYSISDADTLAEFQTLLEGMWSSGEGLFRGISVSPATGVQVIVYYYPVFDDQGNGIGYVGVGLSTDYLLSMLNSVEFSGLDHAYNTLIQTSNNKYIYSGNDESLTDTEVTDTAELAIIDEAVNGTAVSTESGDARVSGNYTHTVNGTSTVSAYAYDEDYGILLIVSDKESEVMTAASSLTTVLVVISVIIAFLMAVLTFVVVSFSIKDLTVVSKVVDDVATTLDLSKATQLDKYAERTDEVGMVSHATLMLTKSIGDAAEALQRRGRELMETAENLAGISDQTLTNVNQVESAVSDIADGATSQATETERASSSVVEIGSQIQDAALATESIMTTSEEMREASRNVTEVIDKLVAIGEQTTAAIDEIYEQTNTTNNSAVKIKQATEIITGIAEETNLLSLNASIEAARAGEQGKGFAVVASQIQKLAEQSSASAQQIEAVIAALIDDSNKAVETMEEVKKIMVQQSEYVNETGEIFGKVKTGIDQTLNGLNEISDRTTQIDSSRQNVVDVVENLSAIAEENAASTEETSASVTIVNDLMTDISDAAKNVSKISEDMDKELSIFKL
ncbi:MAG: hypothetical protein K5840_08250 [Eubacterium sp.]|nr:hypothetical protein [Eubacterium sp.]